MKVSESRRRTVFASLLTIAIICLTYLTLAIVSSVTRDSLAREDGPIENLGAAAFLAGAMVFLVRFRWFRTSCRRPFYLLAAVVCMLAFLEEISWGQRLFGFQSPAWFSFNNVQQEFNLHNLKWFDARSTGATQVTWPHYFFRAGVLFNVFWFGFLVVVPLLARYLPQLPQVWSALHIPLVPPWLSVAFVLNYLIFKMLEYLQPPSIVWSLREAFESLYAGLVLVAACL